MNMCHPGRGLAALVAASLALTGTLPASLTTDQLLYYWDASDASTATASSWTSKAGSQGGNNDVWTVQAFVNQVAATSGSAGITTAYQTGSWTVGSLSGSVTRDNFSPGTSGITGESVSYELWVKPDSLADGRQIVFETGGSTRGHHLAIDNDQVIVAVKTSNPGAALAPAADQIVTHTLSPGDEADFIQIVVTIDGVADTIGLYVNPVTEASPGTAKGSSTWSTGDQPYGSSPASLGGINGANSGSGEIGGGGSSTAPWQVADYLGFLGEYAIMRVYNKVLTGTEVADNFNATFNGPAVVTNAPLSVAAGTTGTPVTDEFHLLTDDSDTAATGLTYTLTSLPAGGTLKINGADAVLGSNDTFTQDDVNNDLLTFDAGAVAAIGDSFAFDVSDGTCTVSGTFTINVAVGGSAVADLFSPDEDTVATEASLANLLANDTGDPISITEVDGNPANVGTEIVTAQGARLTVNADGTFSYDPTGSAALQNGGGADSFTYTIEDFFGGTSTETVSLTVTSVNDVPQAINDLGVGSTFEDGVINSTADLTANDGVVRTDAGLTDILLLNYDARNGSADRWQNLGSNSPVAMDWLLGSGVTRNASVTSSRAQITAAYEWDGTANATATIDPAFGRGIHDIMPGNPDAGPATLEFWIKLDAADLLQPSTIFETGGGTGVGIVATNGILEAATGLEGPTLAGSYVSYDLQTDPLGLVGGDPTAEFFQVVLAIDAGVGLRLYVNGTLVDTSNSAQADWDGGDNTGIGRFAGDNHGGFINGTAGTFYDTYFNGSMAVMRLYSGVLSSNEVLQNFVAVDAGTDLDGESVSVSGILDLGSSPVGVGVPVNLASGAIVTLDGSTGAFTYDPNGAFDDLTDGETATDSFTYEATDGAGGSSLADVTVNINGKNDAADDTIAVREFEVTTFRASAIVGNDEHTAGVPTPYIELDLLNASGGTITNTGTAGGGFDATIVGGTVLTQPDTQSNFGALGASIEDPIVTLATLDPISTGNATLELWFRPATGTTGRQVLFETGGSGNGSSIVYDADRDEVVVIVDSGTDSDASTQITVAVTGVVKDEFNQLAVVYDKNNPGVEDSVSVYLNNEPGAFDPSSIQVTNTAGGADDWAGTDGSGLGTVSGTAANSQSLNDFLGEIAVFRVYSRALDANEIEANFDAEDDSIVSLPPGSPVTTALNATVTLNPDGSFTYDATTLNVDVADGAVQQDTFTYTISDGAGGSSLATVTVDITGVDNGFYAVDDSVVIGEDDGPMSFNPLANDIGAGTATIVFPAVVDSASTALSMSGAVAGDPADFTAGGFGWQLLWNAPSDWDGVSSTTAVDGALGDIANYELLTWSGTAWRPDGDDDTATGDPAGFLNLTTTGGHTGLGSGQTGTTPADNALDRAPILAYTVDTTAIYGIANSSLGRPSNNSGTVSANVYVGSTLIDVVTCGPGQTVDFDMNVGTVNSGETIYVAITPDVAAGNDTFTLDFDIVTLPSLDTPVDDLTGFSTDGATITFDPAMGFESLALGGSTTRTISYTIVDGASTSVGTFTVTINGANDAPTPADDNGGTIDEDGVLVGGGVLANDTDPDQGETPTLVVSAVAGGGGNVGVPTATDNGGSITLNADGTFSYTAPPSAQSLTVGEQITDTVSYSIADTNGLAGTGDATITITVTGSDDGVTATADDFVVSSGNTLNGNLITADNGNGVDSSVDTSDQLTILQIDTTGTNGVVTAVTPGVIGIVGESNIDIADFNADNFVTVNYGITTFVNPVVIAGPASNNEAEPTGVRVRNVNAVAGTFELALWEQPNTPDPAQDGFTDNDPPSTPDLHAIETVSWIVVDAGASGNAQYQLPNGALMEVGSLSTTSVANTFDTVNFTTSFPTLPAVFTSFQTLDGGTAENNELFAVRSRNVTAGGFEVALQDWEGATAARTTPETIGWVAVETGSGNVGGTLWEVGNTPNAVVQTPYAIDFVQDYGSAPHFIAKMQTTDGVDPTLERYLNLTGSSVEVYVQEDTILQAEIGHADEIVGYFCFSNGGGTIIGADVSSGGAGDFSYDPNGFTGTDTFTYTLTDGKGNVSVATVTIEVTGNVDTDSDGIPDSFEDITPGLDSNNPNDALADQDGDGATAIWEYGMGTDINDPNDTPTFTVERFDATQNKITLGPIKAGRTYLLYEGDSAPLTQVDSFTAGADAATHEFFRNRALPAGLYKAEVVLPLP